MIEADNCRFGEKLEFRGRGLGPWMAQDNLMVDVVGTNDRVDVGVSSSRYAEPAAAGTRPVCKTV